MKKTLLAIITVILITGCTQKEEDKKYDFKDPKNELENAKIEVSIDQILFDGERISFDLYLQKPDLDLDEKDFDKEMALTVDLPIQLQPRLMYLTSPNEKEFGYGSMCDRPRFPHRCETSVEDKSAKSVTYGIQIVFEDETYAEATVEIPIPEALKTPEIISPSRTPEQNSTFDMTFKDVGADTYEIAMHLCEPYGNDGINPCLNGTEHTIRRVDGKLKFFNDNSTSKPLLEEKSGNIIFTSYYPVNFTESVEYSVTARKTTNINDINVILTSYSSINFQ